MLFRLVCIIFALVLWVPVSACRSGPMAVDVHFEKIPGLAPGDRVVFENHTAGTVEAVASDPNGTYAVRVVIDEHYRPFLTEYAQFRIVSDPSTPHQRVMELVVLQKGGKPLPDGASVTGVSAEDDIVERFQKDMDAGLEYFKKQVEDFTRELQEIPESEAYRRLKESIEELAREISRVGKQAGKKVKEQWLPQIEQELDELKKQLREQGREKEAEPLQEENERIRIL